MANLNKVLLIGNLTRDPELRYTTSGVAVTNLRLAVNHRYKDRSGELKEDTCFITVTAWDRQAETCNQYLHKGRLVFVEGRLQSRSWETSEGQKRNTIDVRAERIQFLDSRGGGGSGGGAAKAGAAASSQPAQSDSSSSQGGGSTGWDDEGGSGNNSDSGAEDMAWEEE